MCFQFTHLPCDDWENVYFVLFIIKSEVWTITHCLGLGHETMVCALCLSIFLCRYGSWHAATLQDICTHHSKPATNGKNIIIGVEFHNVGQGKPHVYFHRIIRVHHWPH